jgi:sugar lactone lactonase YvrE
VEVRFQGGNPRIWAAAAGPDDVVYLATGEEGVVLRLDASDTVTEHFKVDSGVVQALAVGPDGTLYVGVSQPARVYQLTPAAPEPVRPWIELDATYVWDMELDDDGTLWVGTGEQGALWRVNAAGQAESVYAGGDAHVRSVALAPAGGVLAGTSGQGLVLRVDEAGSVFVLLDSDFEEITGLGVLDDELWVAGNAGTAPAANGNGNGTATNGTSDPSGGVYRIDAGGVPELMWRSATVGLHSLAIVGGEVLVGTGTVGQVLRVTERRAAGLLVDLDSEQIVAIVELADGALVVGSNGAAAYRLRPEARESGSVLTAVRDAGAAATWGELRYEARAEALASVQIYVRTGNTGIPDGTWSAWAGPYTRSGVDVEVPTARFAQIRADLTQPQTQPRLRRLELVYVPRNSRPEIHALRVHPAGVVYRQNASFEDGLPFAQVPAVVAAELREQEQGQGSGVTTVGGATFRGRPLFIPGRRTFTWEASDPDGDTLSLRLDFRSEGVERWNPLAMDLEGSSYVFDTTRVPDGRYQVHLTASDTADNAAAAVLAASATSPVFVVDNTPPSVTGLSAAAEQDTVVRVAGRASDATSIVLRIRYSVNGGAWHTVLHADGAADSAEEPFEFDVSIAGGGEHTIVVQVTDSALNRGAGQVTVQR